MNSRAVILLDRAHTSINQVRYHEMIVGGVIKPNAAPGSKAALVYGQMNEPPGLSKH